MGIDLNETHTNRIEGVPSPPRAGGRFEAAGESWSRSGPLDVSDALASLARGAPGWFQEVSARPDRQVQAPGPGICVVRRSWCEGQAALRACLEAELSAGWAVALLSDGREPAQAEAAFSGLEGVPPDAVALLFDDGDEALRAAVTAPQVGRVVLSGHEGDAARLAGLLDRARQVEGFGMGVLESGSREVTFEILRPGESVVREGEDPDEAARRVLRDALGRDETRSGQLACQVGRVLVHPRSMSRFTAALLTALEEKGEVDPPLDPVEGDLAAFLEAARVLGLDEGATLIHEQRVGSPRGGAAGRIARLVFTNVEHKMRLWGLARPAPLLLLSRGTDGTHE